MQIDVRGASPRRSLLGGMRGRDAAALFLGEAASEDAKGLVLEVALVWGDTVLETGRLREGTLELGGPAALFGAGIRAEVAQGGAVVAAQQGMQVFPREGVSYRAHRAEIGPGDRIRMAAGPLTLVLRFVSLVEQERADRRVDLAFGRTLSVVAMAGAVLTAMLSITPRTDDILADDLFADRPRWMPVRTLVEPRTPPPEIRIPKDPGSAPKEPGMVGRPFGPRRETEPSRHLGSKRERDQRLVGSMLDKLFASDGLSDVLSSGTLGGGVNEALGGLKPGGALADAGGFGGMHSRGTGPGGGGGNGFSLGKLGPGSGPGGGKYDGISFGGRDKPRTEIKPGKTVVIGGLDKSVIGDVIRRNEGAIKYCYESELQKDPELQGKVSLMFTITAAGTVGDVLVQENTMASGAVARCMQGRVQRFRFPEPKGGGEVVVTYPWVFRAAGN